MARVVVNDAYLTDIADAIRAKNGTQNTYTPAEMSSAIDAIPTGGSSTLGTKTITANGTYDASDDSLDGYSEVTVNVSGGGGGGNFALIGTKVFENLSEYTDTTTAEELNTNINISNTDYAWGYVVVTCDTSIGTNAEWGMSVALFGRQSNGNIQSVTYQQKGSSTLSFADMINPCSSIGQGVNIKSGQGNIVITRKGHSSNYTKCRAGNYTVKVYGMTGI